MGVNSLKENRELDRISFEVMIPNKSPYYLSFVLLFFRESWEKANVTWLDGGNKVEFGQKKTYHFQPDLSTAGEDTKLILPNLPMLVRFSHFSKKANKDIFKLHTMAIQVVEFSNGGYKIRKGFA